MNHPVYKQVLILNIARMGDVVQTMPLINRLHHEWPGVAIDLIVDRRVAPAASLLPGLRRVLSRDLSERTSKGSEDTSEDLQSSAGLAAWLQALKARGYDRVINLTFTRRSGQLASLVVAPDTRGVISVNGISVLNNPWFAYCVDMHRSRRLNRFHIADLLALGGSGPGPWMPIRLSVPLWAESWADQFFESLGHRHTVIAVQIGASHGRKTWRPENFGRTLAAISRQADAAFVLIGTAGETEPAAHALAAYHAAGGTQPLHNAIGRTDIPQLAALLRRSRFLLTNDTGPMHVAAGVGTPVINLSLGHVDFHETGPHGPGHWIIQPDIACAPCDIEQTCVHHVCKDQIIPEQVAALSLHALGLRSFPQSWTGVRIYESDVDADGLVRYRQRVGERDLSVDWYGAFWRRYWYEQFTDCVSNLECQEDAPDFVEQHQRFQRLAPALNRIVECAERLRDISRHASSSSSTAMLKAAQNELVAERQRVLFFIKDSPVFGPLTTVLLRELYDLRVLDQAARVERQVQTYRIWRKRMHQVGNRLGQTPGAPVGAQPAGQFREDCTTEVGREQRANN
ncbi:glycosyltransferase family 9 protein [Nitrospira sp. KM1]|uniref:glycosyltransferase family 9 protein n=1 Tax=Nitrospira sp. KM1 TaxID=1936990 RepID=UPI0015659B6B|nr:glycosyltransferase family 9 protein [Nitrospira sp. KM1]